MANTSNASLYILFVSLCRFYIFLLKFSILKAAQKGTVSSYNDEYGGKAQIE